LLHYDLQRLCFVRESCEQSEKGLVKQRGDAIEAYMAAVTLDASWKSESEGKDVVHDWLLGVMMLRLRKWIWNRFTDNPLSFLASLETDIPREVVLEWRDAQVRGGHLRPDAAWSDCDLPQDNPYSQFRNAERNYIPAIIKAFSRARQHDVLQGNVDDEERETFGSKTSWEMQHLIVTVFNDLGVSQLRVQRFWEEMKKYFDLNLEKSLEKCQTGITYLIRYYRVHPLSVDRRLMS